MSRRDASYGPHNRATLLATGAVYFERMEALIDAARTSVHLQVYIFANDATGARIGAALVRAAQRGVQVFLLADGYASQDLSSVLVERLRAAGGHFRWFQPLLRSRRFYIGRRMHHKVLVVDHRHALVSGRNIADRYTDLDGQPAWYDMAVEVEGEAALDLARLCCQVWNGRMPRTRRVRALPPTEEDRNSLVQRWPIDVRCLVRVRFNDWLLGHAQITNSYAQMFRDARAEVHLMASYFVPGRVLKKAMARAVQRGVRLRVILTGRSDVWIAKPAERWLYAWLLRRGAEVYEYQKSVLHAKVAVRDAEWTTLGSFNLNDLSSFTTLEVNLDVADAPLSTSIRSDLDRTVREDCRRITTEDLRRTGMLGRLGQWCAYRALRLLHGLLTFYYIRQAGERREQVNSR